MGGRALSNTGAQSREATLKPDREFLDVETLEHRAQREPAYHTPPTDPSS